MMHCLLLLMSIVTLLFEKLAQFWIILDNLLQLKLTVRWDLSSLRHSATQSVCVEFRFPLTIVTAIISRDCVTCYMSRCHAAATLMQQKIIAHCTCIIYIWSCLDISTTHIYVIYLQQNHQNFIRSRYNLFVFLGPNIIVILVIFDLCYWIWANVNDMCWPWQIKWL